MKENNNKYIDKCNIKFNNKFDYSLVKDHYNTNKVNVICPKHGVFETTLYQHFNTKYGCKKCANELLSIKMKQTTNEFIEKSKKIYGDGTFDYSETKYIGALTPIKIICKTHGLFTTYYQNHITQKYGCPHCVRDKRKMKYNECLEKIYNCLIEKAKEKYNNKYIYPNKIDNIDYKHPDEKIKIYCPTHGYFEMPLNTHIKRGCIRCNSPIIGDLDKFKKIASTKHNNKYDYSLVDLKDWDKKIKIICPEHGIFEQSINSHIYQGSGCRKCGNERKGFYKINEDENNLPIYGLKKYKY